MQIRVVFRGFVQRVDGVARQMAERVEAAMRTARRPLGALGHDAPEMRRCPLVPKDVEASVSAKDTGFEVELQSWDPDSAREVLRRAQSLIGAP